MKDILLYLWQLPQNWLGLILLKVTGAEKENGVYIWKIPAGLSLGQFVFVNKTADEITIAHEKGHQKQSLYLGWLYLIIIGLPSFVWAILKAFGCFKDIDYYSFYTEKWADKLAGVKRG